MAKCLQKLKSCKTVAERQDFSFNLTDEFARHWEANRPFNDGTAIRPATLPGTGFEYASSGGVTNGEAEPTWPTVEGGEVADGSIAGWVAQTMSNDGLRHRITDVTWTPPAGITVSDQAEIDEPALQEIRVWVNPGGTIGDKVTIVATIETDQGAIFECHLELTLE